MEINSKRASSTSWVVLLLVSDGEVSDGVNRSDTQVSDNEDAEVTDDG